MGKRNQLPLRILLLLIWSSIAKCSDLETSGVPTFFDPKYHDDGSRETKVVEYSPVESIHSPTFVSFPRPNPTVTYFLQEDKRKHLASNSKPSTINVKAQNYISGFSFPKPTTKSGSGEEKKTPCDKITQEQSASNGLDHVSISEIKWPSDKEKNEYQNIPLLHAEGPTSSNSQTKYISQKYEKPKEPIQNEYKSSEYDFRQEPQHYFPGEGWGPMPQPQPVNNEGYHGFKSEPSQEYHYFSDPEHYPNSLYGSQPPKPSAFQGITSGIQSIYNSIKPLSSYFRAGPSYIKDGELKPLENLYPFQAAQSAPTVSSPQTPSQSNPFPQAPSGSGPLYYFPPAPAPPQFTIFRPAAPQYLSRPPPVPRPPKITSKPLSSFYSPVSKEKIPDFDDGISFTHSDLPKEVSEHSSSLKQEYAKPVSSHSVTEEEYNSHLADFQPPRQMDDFYNQVAEEASGFYKQPSYSSQIKYTSPFSYGHDEDFLSASSPYYRPKNKRPASSSSYGYGSFKRPILDYNPSSLNYNYGTPHDLITKGPYILPSPTKSRNKGPSTQIAPIKEYQYKYSTVNQNPEITYGKDYISPYDKEYEALPDEVDLDTFNDFNDCENQHNCNTNIDYEDISQTVDLTKKPKRRLRFRNNFFKTLIRNIAGKPRRRPPPPPPPPRPRQLHPRNRQRRPCRGKRCQAKYNLVSNNNRKVVIIVNK